MLLLIETNEGMPLYLPQKEEMSDEELYAFCRSNPHLRFERDEHNQIYIMAPTGGETGNRHVQIVLEVEQWNRQHKLGKTFDSSTGFKLPDSSMRSPDAAWITNEKWNSLSDEQKERFIPFAPDFLVEVLSPTDHLDPARQKMNKWMQNGVRLGWLIVPKQHLVFIYRYDGTVNKVQGFDNRLSGEDVLPQFEFDLSILL